MKLIVIAGLTCIFVSGCRDGAEGASAEKNRATADTAILIIVDRRDPSIDHVTIVFGSRAFTQATPFRSEDPPTGRRETAQFPRDGLLMLEKAAAAEGLEPPFVPEGPVLSIGTVAPPDPEISWRYFEAGNADIVACFDDVRSTMQSVGTSTDDIPSWIVSEEILTLLERE